MSKRPILEHPKVAAWLAALPPDDAREIEGQWAFGRPALPDGHRAYFYFALACLDAPPSPDPTYAPLAGGHSWLAALIECYEKVQSDVVLQLALDQAGTAQDLQHLVGAPGMDAPWSLLSLTDLHALADQPGCTLQSLAHELCNLQTDRERTLAPDHKALKQSLATKRLELDRDYH